MADVRSLLQKEREARRIQHPHLSYTKSGALTCVVCQLNVKSEALWEGHLRSANHRKNLQLLRDGVNSTNGATTGKKRKIEEVEDDIRKKNKSEKTPEADVAARENGVKPDNIEQVADAPEAEITEHPAPHPDATAMSNNPSPTTSKEPPVLSETAATIDEDEWAAFEREVVPLTHDPPPSTTNYGAATISAAPMSAAEVTAQKESDRRSKREVEAEDEKEEEERRMEDEFDVMEEMEERVRRLKEKREALRRSQPVMNNDNDEIRGDVVNKPAATRSPSENDEDEDDGDGDEIDDWYS